MSDERVGRFVRVGEYLPVVLDRLGLADPLPKAPAEPAGVAS